MAKSKYKQFHDHKEIEVQPGVGLNFACCDCALVHDLQIRLEDGKVFVSFTRDNRATGQLRRRYHTPMVKRLTMRRADVSACPRCKEEGLRIVDTCVGCGYDYSKRRSR